jgi:hypothetical protein
MADLGHIKAGDPRHFVADKGSLIIFRQEQKIGPKVTASNPKHGQTRKED